MTSAEIELKGTKEDAIVFYDILIQLVHKTNVEGEVVSVLMQILDEEKSMVEWIMSNTPVMLTQLWSDIEASIIKKEIDEEKQVQVH